MDEGVAEGSTIFIVGRDAGGLVVLREGLGDEFDVVEGGRLGAGFVGEGYEQLLGEGAGVS